jgi:hypothetical protein
MDLLAPLLVFFCVRFAFWLMKIDDMAEGKLPNGFVINTKWLIPNL